MSQPEFQKIWAQMVQKAWSDANFKQRLLQNPAAVLQEHGVKIPAGHTLKVVENSDTVTHLILPARPDEELSLEDLDKVAGGETWLIPLPRFHLHLFETLINSGK